MKNGAFRGWPFIVVPKVEPMAEVVVWDAVGQAEHCALREASLCALLFVPQQLRLSRGAARVETPQDGWRRVIHSIPQREGLFVRVISVEDAEAEVGAGAIMIASTGGREYLLRECVCQRMNDI